MKSDAVADADMMLHITTGTNAYVVTYFIFLTYEHPMSGAKIFADLISGVNDGMRINPGAAGYVCWSFAGRLSSRRLADDNKRAQRKVAFPNDA